MNINRDILSLAIHHFGSNVQKDKAIEEMAELIQIIIKARLPTSKMTAFQVNTYKHLITGEIANVYVTLESLKMIHGINDDEIQKIIDEKITYLSEYLPLNQKDE